MATSEISDGESFASQRKIAQLYSAIKGNFNIAYIKSILRKEGNINYKTTNSNKIASVYAEFGILFLAADDYMSLEVFEFLLNHDANFTAKDDKGHTVVHKIMKKQYQKARNSSYIEFSNQFIDSVLSAHVKFENQSNPHCEYNFSHFHAACQRNNAEAITFFLKNGVDVNEAVNEDSLIYAGFTGLHFAVEFTCPLAVQILLNNGADMHVKNAAGLSPLDLSLQRSINNKAWEWRVKDGNILEVLAKHFIKANKNNNFGFSSLHLACVLKDTSVVESVLSHQSLDINQPIKETSPVYPGYTPLHFATIFSVDTVKLLIDRGADFEAKDAHGTTPFDLCLQTHDLKDIHHIMLNQKRWKNITLSDNKTKLVDLVSVMTSDNELDKFLANFESIADLSVPKDSPLWAGYTVLHVAVVLSELPLDRKTSLYYYICLTKKIEKLVCRGADITKTDVNGLTALHLAFYLKKPHLINGLLKYCSGNENPTDNNKITHFHIACSVKNYNAVERFLSNKTVDVNAPISSSIKWPALIKSYTKDTSEFMVLTAGSTPLHINVKSGDYRITELLLQNGADVYAKDIEGFTPIHRLYGIHTDTKVVDTLLNISGLRDCTAPGGLTHLHVACRLCRHGAVARLLDSGADINAVLNCYTSKEFLEEGEKFDEILYGWRSRQNPLPFVSRYNGFTPLHFALQVQECHDDEIGGEIQKMLIERGVDLLAGNSSTCVPIQIIFGEEHEYDEFIVSIIGANKTLKNSLKEQIGLTMLHIVCYANKLGLVKDLLLQGENLNSQVDENSPIWPGDTPLHVVARNFTMFEDQDDFTEIITLLVDYGANITMNNKNGDNSLQLLTKLYKKTLALSECARVFLKPLKEYDVSAAHSQLISFFHFACLMKNFSIVEGFIKNGVDVNRPVSLFVDCYAGCTPLHLATSHTLKASSDWNSQKQIVTLLIEKGADIRAKDIIDNTPIHNVAGLSANRKELFDIFIRSGIDVNAENIHGETALEIMIDSRDAHWEDIEYLLQHGSKINSFNPVTQVGYIAKMFQDSVHDNWRGEEGDLVQCLINSKYVSEINEQGRTVLHNLISIGQDDFLVYGNLIEQLINRGCNINHQDKQGRTALNLAAQFKNTKAIFGLLRKGADINIIDNEGKTAFEYSLEKFCTDPSIFHEPIDPEYVRLFVYHIAKMKFCGFFVNEDNRRLLIKAQDIDIWEENVPDKFYEDVQKSKYVKIGSTDLTLHDFGFKIDAEMIYPVISYEERLEIDDFFANIQQYKLYELDYIINIKYRNAVKRLRLIDLAVKPFGSLVKKPLPALCCRIIVSFLSSGDLKNIIATETL